MFSGLRQNSLLYILDKGENISLKIAQVSNISNPQSRYGQYSVPMLGQQQDTTVDITAKVGDESFEFKQVPSGLSVATISPRLTISDSKEAMNAEVEAMMRTSKCIIESIPYHQRVLDSCDAIFKELNPQFAKEKAQEEKIGVLERRMGDIEGVLGDIKTMLGRSLNIDNKE